MSLNSNKDEETLWGIPKLEGGSNYHEWSYDAEMVLRGKGLWTIVEGSEVLGDAPSAAVKRDFDARSSLSLSILTRTLQRGPKMLIYAERDPAKIWTSLSGKYQPKGRIYQVSLRSQYIKLLASSSSAVNMTTYLTELKVTVDKLAAVGVHMEEEVVTLDLLASLPTAFKTLVTAVSAQKEIPALSFVEEKVLEEEGRLQDHDDRPLPGGNAFAVGQASKPPHNTSSKPTFLNNANNNTPTSIPTDGRKCEWCGMQNHWTSTCIRRLAHTELLETYLKHNNIQPRTDKTTNRDFTAMVIERHQAQQDDPVNLEFEIYS